MKLIFLLALATAIYVLAISSSIMVNKENIMKIFSTTFKEGEAIPLKYTCDGDDVNPILNISGTPKETKSFALLMDDPDSPSGNFTHWIIWNIQPSETEIKENGKLEGTVEGVNGFGNIGYGGPCPHSGTHRYFFRLYALDQMLDLSSGADVAMLKQAIEGHVLAEAELMGNYSRR